MNWLKEFVYRFRGEYTTEKLIKMGMKEFWPAEWSNLGSISLLVD